MILAQTTFTIRRLAKDELNLVFSSDTVTIPVNNGVADLSIAEFGVKVTKGGRELFPVFDEEIGGRNLVPKSNFVGLGNSNGWNVDNNPLYNGGVALKLDNGRKAERRLNNLDNCPIGSYTLSARYYISPEYNTGSRIATAFTQPNNIHNNLFGVKVGEWHTISLVFENTIEGSDIRVSLYNTDTFTQGYIIVDWIKLEKGTIPTDWTPAIEDTLSNAIITPHNCTAVIDNDKIKITSITPDKKAGYVDVTVSYGEDNTTLRRFTWATADSGVSITKVDVEFAVNTNKTTPPTTGWNTLAPTSLTATQQLWTRTVTYFSKGNPNYSLPANITPQIGQGVESIVEEFAISTSKTTQPTTGWSTDQPTWSSGKYIWSRVKITYKNPTDIKYTGYAVSAEWEAVNELETTINTKVDTAFDVLDDKIQANVTEITTAKNNITGLTTRLSKAETDITLTATDITLKASKTEAQEYVTDAIDNLEIGGRNLILNSLNRIGVYSNNPATQPIQDQAVSGENYRQFRRTYPEGVTNTEIRTNTANYFTPEKSGYYTYSTYFRPNEFDIELRLRFGNPTYGSFILCKANEWTQISVTTYIEAGVATHLYGVYGWMPPEVVQWIDYNRVSVTGGNKATDWTPAIEDVEANIETSKTEAENAAKAYANTKAEAERVLAEAYADDIVSDEEARAIADALDKYNEAKSHAEQLVKDIEIGGRNLFISNQSLWERGTILFVHGTNASNNSRVRTIGFLPMESNQNYYLSIHSEHNVAIYAYDEDDNFLGLLGGTSWITESTILQSPTGTAKFKTVITKKDEATITLDELENVIVKFEKGNKATDWSPAPEDVLAEIIRVETKSEAAINLANDNITAVATRATTLENTAGNLTTRLASAELKITPESITSTVTSSSKYTTDLASKETPEGALSKANTAKANAISEAAIDTTNKINSIEIGGRNLWRYSGDKYLTKAFVYGADRTKVDIKIIQGYTSFWFNESYSGSFRIASIPVKPLTTYTYSFVAFLDEDSTELTSLTLSILPLSFSDTSNSKSFILSTKPTRFDLTITSLENTTNTLPHIYGGSTGIVMANFMLVEGNKSTNWTPAPEDVQSEIASKVATSTYESKMTQLDNAISARVTQEDFNALGQRVGAAEGTLTTQAGLIEAKASASSVTTLGSRVTTAENTIDAHTGQINSKVAKTDYDANNSAIQTQFSNISQRADGIELSVTNVNNKVEDIEIGGRNLLPDSDFRYGGRGWSPANVYTEEGTGINYALTYNESLGYIFPEEVKRTKNWVISFDVIKNDTTQVDSPIRLYLRNVTRDVTINYYAEPATEKWERRVIPFISEADLEDTYRFWLLTSNKTTRIRITNVKLEKGNKATDWTPSPEDVEANAANPMTPVRYIRSYLKGSNINNNNTWVQIQALNKIGENVALGKTVTASTTGSNLERITNGITDYNNTANVSNTGKVEWVQVDLGKVYYDINSILQHNYWYSTPPTLADRVFNDTKIEVSTDGTTWKIIFDSKQSGKYVETSSGKRFMVNKDSVVAYDYESKIKQAADSISLAVYNKTLDKLNPASEIKLTSDSIRLNVANDIATAVSTASSDATTKANNAKTGAINTAADDATTKANNAKSDAISAAATDATNKVNGLKTNLSGTGINIEAGILTLYSGAKDGNAGGQVVIAGSNFSVDEEGKIKAVDGDFSGKIHATEGDIGSMKLQSDMLVSSREKLIIDGTNSTITLKDDSTDAVRILIKSNNLPTSPSMFFGSLSKSASFAAMKTTLAMSGATVSSGTIYVGANDSYSFNIPSITLIATVTAPSLSGDYKIAAYATAELYLTNGTLVIPIGSVQAKSSFGNDTKSSVFLATTRTVTSSGSWRLQFKYTLNRGGFNSGLVSGNAKLESSETNYSAAPIVNRSEFGSNGLIVATTANQYAFMVGDTFEIKRQNHMFRVNSSDIQMSKNGGSLWRSLYSGVLGVVHFTLGSGVTYQWTKDGTSITLTAATNNPFRINHSIGHTNYFAVPIVQAKYGYLQPSTRASTYCTFSKSEIENGHEITVLLIGNG